MTGTRLLFLSLILTLSGCSGLAELLEPTPVPTMEPTATVTSASPTPRPSTSTAPPPPPRGAIGVYIASVDKAWRRLLNLGPDPGTVIVLVMPNSPAARAGLMAGDTVVALNDQPVRNAQELQRRLPKPVGTNVRLTILRGTQRLNLTATTVAGPALDQLEEQALVEARARVQAAPDDPLALYRLSLLLPSEDADAAIEHLTRAITLAPDFASAYLERGGRWIDQYLVAAQRLGPQPDANPFFLPALDDHTAAVELEPELWDAFNDRSNFFYITQEFPLAAADGLRLTELDPEEPRSWIRLGWGLYGLRQFPVAEEAFLRALQLDAEQEEAHFGLGRVYREQSPADNAKSVAAYRNVLRYSFNEARRSEALAWIDLLTP